MAYIYKIVYPNGKIYVGQDSSKNSSFTYFGSPTGAADEMEKDFSTLQKKHFAIIKEILWEKENATPEELNKKESEFIKQFNSSDKSIGYNRRFPINI